MPPQSPIPMVPGGTVSEWLTLLALVAGPGLAATVAWSPVLAVGRLRALFRRLPLTRSTGVNYVLVALALSVPWVAGLGWGLAEVGSQAPVGASGDPLAGVAVQLAGLYVVGLPVAAGAGLPLVGVDWDPADYEPWTWVALVAASAWYAAIFAVPALLMAFVFSL